MTWLTRVIVNRFRFLPSVGEQVGATSQKQETQLDTRRRASQGNRARETL